MAYDKPSQEGNNAGDMIQGFKSSRDFLGV